MLVGLLRVLTGAGHMSTVSASLMLTEEVIQ